MATRLKDAVKLGDLPRKGGVLELDVAPAPGSSWPTGGVDVFCPPGAASSTSLNGLGANAPAGGSAPSSRGHSRGASRGSLGSLGGDDDDWMDSLAGVFAARCRLPRGCPTAAIDIAGLGDATTVAALKLKVMDRLANMPPASLRLPPPQEPSGTAPVAPAPTPAPAPGSSPSRHHPSHPSSSPSRAKLSSLGARPHPVDPNPLTRSTDGSPRSTTASSTGQASGSRSMSRGSSSGSLLGVFNDLSEFAHGVAEAAEELVAPSPAKRVPTMNTGGVPTENGTRARPSSTYELGRLRDDDLDDLDELDDDDWRVVRGNPKPEKPEKPRNPDPSRRVSSTAAAFGPPAPPAAASTRPPRSRAGRLVHDGMGASRSVSVAGGDEKAHTRPTVLGGSAAEAALAVLPPAAVAPARAFLVAARRAMHHHVPAVAAWPPVAHLVLFATLAALFVQAMGFALWCALAVCVASARAMDAENRRIDAERRAVEWQREAGKARDEADRASFAMAAAAAAASAASSRDEEYFRGEVRSDCVRGERSDPHAQFLLGGVVSGGDTAWLSTSLAAAWSGFLRDWLSRLVFDAASDKLSAATPAALESAKPRAFAFGDAAPPVDDVRVLRSRRQTNGRVVLELGIRIGAIEGRLDLACALAAVGVPVNVDAAFRAESLDLRLGLVFSDRAPYVETTRVSLAEMPRTRVDLNPEGLGGLSVTDLPGVDAWVQSAVEITLARTVLEPNAHEWDVRGWWERRGREAEEAEEARVVRAVNDSLRDLAR